jgi:hypothetical protein
MKNSFLLATLLGVTVSSAAAFSEEGKAGKGQSKQDAGAPRLKLYGQIDMVNAACGAAGVTLSSKQFPCKIDKVRMGSPAAYAGLCQNDKVLKAGIEDNKLSILIQRGGQQYAVKLNTARDPIALGQTATRDKSGVDVPAMSQTAALTAVSKYDIVLIVDRSGSMASKLSPDDEMSKWQWCQNNISGFTRDIAPLLENNQLTLLFFDSQFSIVRNCTPNTVQRTFEELRPRGGTNMGPPMEAVLSDYFKGRQSRPLLVIVLTDGLPGDPAYVEKTIINATNKLADSGQLKIRFLEIGEEYSGAALLELLDNHLVSQGAKYDVVDYASFEEVSKLGLARAMVAKVSPVKNKPGVAGGSMEYQLYALRKEIEELNSSRANK